MGGGECASTVQSGEICDLATLPHCVLCHNTLFCIQNCYLIFKTIPKPFLTCFGVEKQSHGFMQAFLAPPLTGRTRKMTRRRRRMLVLLCLPSLGREALTEPEPQWVGVAQRHKGMHHSLKERDEGGGIKFI